MYNGRDILAVIPARGGSKGLPGKNIRMLAGKPLIAWSIEAAKASRYVDRLIVSTDSVEIADTAKQWGAEAPFLRPANLATDEAKGMDVVLHALEQLGPTSSSSSLVLLLQPTSPLRTTDDIDKALEMLEQKEAQAIVSVCQVEHHPWWSNTLPLDGSLADFIRPELRTTNRQSLPIYFRLNGAIYLANIGFIKETQSFLGQGCYAYVMPQERSVDIDSLLDFRLVETLLGQATLREGTLDGLAQALNPTGGERRH